MADQQITISYDVEPIGKQPAAHVSLTLTYDDSQPIKVGQDTAYKLTAASGTYTPAGGTAQQITLLNPEHIGANNNRVYPGRTPVLDRHGVSFTFPDPLKHAPNHVERVNLFFNPKRTVDAIQQYTNYKSRTVENLVITESAQQNNTQSEVQPAVCFAGGTSIRTLRGEIAVEALVVGDIAVTASGTQRPITWIGHRAIDLRRHARPAAVAPVRVAAHAFGPGMPARDLFLSPGHPVLVGADADHEGGYLVPIMCLVNGTTIERVSVPSVTYWHIELDDHDILLAEGLPAESYLDWGDRDFFSDAAGSPLANPDFVVPGLDGRCRPVAIDGPVVEAERDRLDAVFATRLTQACAWPAVTAALDF